MKTTDDQNEFELKVEGFSTETLKRNTFSTPEGYFDNLTPRVMESVRNSGSASQIGWPIWMKLTVPSFGIAVVAIVAWFLTPQPKDEAPDFETVVATLTVEDLVTYADLQPSELVSYDLVDCNQLALNESTLTDEEIFEYLEDMEDVELNTIIDEMEI